MVAILNLPAGFAMSTIRFGGAAYPHGAAITLGHIVATPTDTPGIVATNIRNLLRTTGDPLEPSNGFSASATFVDVLVKFGPLATGPSVVVGDGAAMGAGGGDPSAPSIALLVTKTTPQGGRRGQGRFFWPGLTEAHVTTGGFLAAGNQANFQAKFSKFFNDLTANGIRAHLLHRHDPAKGQTPIAPTQCDSFTVSSQVATQRTRLRK